MVHHDSLVFLCGQSMVQHDMVWFGMVWASCVAPTAGDDGESTPAPPTAPNTPQEQTSSNSKEQTSHQNQTQTQTQTSKETSPEAKRNQANFYLTHEKRRNRKMRQHKPIQLEKSLQKLRKSRHLHIFTSSHTKVTSSKSQKCRARKGRRDKLQDDKLKS